jgi:hypothetical protein
MIAADRELLEAARGGSKDDQCSAEGGKKTLRAT